MSRDGSTVRYSGAPKYNGIFGKPSYIEFSEIASPVPIEWQIGDYVDYTRTGFRYKLYTLPQVAKSARSGESGDAFVYKNVQFYCATKDLEIALFRDIVQYDNGIHFSSIPNVDTYESVYGIIDRIQANMDDFAPGEWTIRAMSTSYTEITDLMSEVREFSLSDGTCMDALNQIYSLWKGISWIYKVENGRHTIVLGRPNLQDASNTTPEFSYGEGNGLKVITRAVSTKNEVATRIYAYGSDRNLPTRYYNNLTPYIKDHESVYIPHLMLPQSDWGTTGGLKDARLAYLENSSAVNTYGLIPKVMRFDGSGDLEDIYPSVEGMTVGDVADEDFPSTGWSDTDPIDEIYACSNPSDDGMYTEDSIKLKGEAVALPVAAVNRTYTTKEGQEAVTLAKDEPIANSETYDQKVNPGHSDGLFVIDMGELSGYVRCTGARLGDYLTEVPKAFVEVYVDDALQVQQEMKVTTTKIESDFGFECDNIKFVSSSFGYIKMYVRVEMPLSPTAPVLSVLYHLNETTIGVQVEYTISKTFTVYTRQLGFDLNAMGVVANNGIGTLSMKTGWCAGRDFVINSASYDADAGTWALECQRQDDTSLMQYFPNNVYQINEDDKFVLLDIQMPSKYVTAAETRLHNAAANALARLCKPVMAYVPEVDSKEVFLASVTLVEGLYMPIYDPDLVETYIPSEPNVNWILISTVTIAENEDVIPIWSVTLRDEKVDSMLQIITGELNAANKRLRDKDVDESRKPAMDDPEAIRVPTVVGVKIQCDSKLFVSDAEGHYDGQTIVLTAKTSGINKPSYRWYYKVVTVTPGEGGEDDTVTTEWRKINGQEAQGYIVEADSEIYYQNDKTWEDFMVRCWETPDEFDGDISERSGYYSDTVRISKGGRGPKGDKGDDGDPGEDGMSYATLHLYKRTSGDPSLLAPDDMTYDFDEKTLTPSSALNGWSVEPPTDAGSWFDIVYVTVANVSSRNDTVLVNGGWDTDNPPGDWSEPTRWTGENGLMGKIMRGVNEWSDEGLPDGRGEGIDGYQGMDEMDSDFEFYDVVYMVDPITNDTLYFYCKDGTGATTVDPITDVATDVQHGKVGRYWVKADNFDFIATKVLLAKNAYIDVLSGNGVYMYGNSGASDGVVVAGMQGGSKTEWPVGSGTMVDQVNFFAGSNVPQNAPFRVDYTGHVTMSDAQIGFLETYTQQGLPWTELRGYYDDVGNTRGVEISPNGFIATTQYTGQQEQDVTRVAIDTFNYDEAPLEVIVGHGVSEAPTAFYTDGAIKATEIKRANGNNWEDVITFDRYNSSQGLDSIFRVVHCTQQDYDYYEYYGYLDDNTFYIISQ